MKKNQTSFFVIIGLFLLSGMFSWRLYFKVYSQSDTVDIHVFPKEVAGWTSEEIEITDHEYDILETRNAFTRKYTNQKGREVYLFIVYSQSNRKVSHPPEICYTGSGATLISSVSRIIDVGDFAVRANKIFVEYGKYQQYMYYWFKVGDTFTSNYWKQQSLIAIKTLFGKPSSSALIRLSSTIKGDDIEEAAGDIEDFAKVITPLLFTYLP